MNRVVVTPAEADTYLAMYPDWLDLDTPVKESHISKASVYAQTVWTCEDVDWDTPEDPLKEAVSYYAYSDSQGNLYGDPATHEELRGKLRSIKNKVGSLSEEQSWYRGGTTAPAKLQQALAYPDQLMGLYCERVNVVTTLVRD